MIYGRQIRWHLSVCTGSNRLSNLPHWTSTSNVYTTVRGLRGLSYMPKLHVTPRERQMLEFKLRHSASNPGSNHHIPCSLDTKGSLFNYLAFLNCRCIILIEITAWPISYSSEHIGEHSLLHGTKEQSSSPNHPCPGVSRKGERQGSRSWERGFYN